MFTVPCALRIGQDGLAVHGPEPGEVPDNRRLRADVNAILNALVREGVIAAFDSKQDSTSALVRRLRIFVVPSSATDPIAAKRAVMTALERFSGSVSVRVKAG